MTCHRLSLPRQKLTKKLGENELNSSSQLLQHQQCGSSRQQCPASRDRMNLGFTQPSPLLQVPPCILTVSNEHYTLLTHPLFTSKSMCGGLEMKHEETFLYKFLSKHVTEYISSTEKESIVQDQISTRAVREHESFPAFPRNAPLLTDGSVPDISTPTCDYSRSSFSPPSLWACFWVTQQLLGSPLLLWPQHWRTTLHPCSLHQAAEPDDSPSRFQLIPSILVARENPNLCEPAKGAGKQRSTPSSSWHALLII